MNMKKNILCKHTQKSMILTVKIKGLKGNIRT